MVVAGWGFRQITWLKFQKTEFFLKVGTEGRNQWSGSRIRDFVSGAHGRPTERGPQRSYCKSPRPPAWGILA